MPLDPRPSARVSNPELLRRLHAEWRECALRDELHPDTPRASDARALSLHHIHKHPRDDVEANLIMLCGDGTTGCHGQIEHRRSMGAFQRVVSERVDTWTYLVEKLGGPVAASDWLDRLVRVKTGGRG